MLHSCSRTLYGAYICQREAVTLPHSRIPCCTSTGALARSILVAEQAWALFTLSVFFLGGIDRYFAYAAGAARAAVAGRRLVQRWA